MQFTYYGHSRLSLTVNSKKLLFDPFITGNKLAILPITGNFTMGMEDAVQAAKMVQTKMVIGVHYDTFGFIKTDHQKAIGLFKSHELELKLPGIGETIEI